LYKRLEIPANKVIPAIAVSVTYRNHEKAENTGSIPVSAINLFIISNLQNYFTGLGLQEARRRVAKAGFLLNCGWSRCIVGASAAGFSFNCPLPG
jgi:hypothetical protein